MKKLLLLLPFIALMASCSKKETVKPALTPKTATAADIQGKWTTAVDTLYSTQNGQTTVTLQDISGESLSFNYGQNNTGNRMENGISTNFIYSIENGVITMNESGTDEVFTVLAISPDRMIIRLTTDANDYIDATLNKQ